MPSEQPMDKPFLKELWRFILTLVAAGVIALVASNFTSSGAESTRRIEVNEREIKSLEKDVIDLKLIIATQQEWNRNVMEMLKEMRSEKANK